MKRKNVKKSQSTNDLYSEIMQAQDRKKIFLNQLKLNVNKSQAIIKKSQSQINLQTKIPQPLRIINRKQKSLDQLTKSLSDRISIDRIASKKFQNLTQQQLQKKEQIEKRMQEIKKRNQHRMKQLEQFQVKYIKKLNQDYKKDKQKQQKLLSEYQKVLDTHGKIRQTKSYRKAIESQDWKAILNEKQKLQKMIKQYRKKQEMLLKDQDPQSIKKIIQKNQVKILIQQKLDIPEVRKQRVKADAKQIGNQYLQYAKKLKQMPKQKPKVKLLDINFKCIDYQGDIMNKIARNTGDLSKIKPPPAAAITTVKQTKFGKESVNKSLVFQIKQDQQTKKYLKQIRNNLKEIQKVN